MGNTHTHTRIYVGLSATLKGKSFSEIVKKKKKKKKGGGVLEE